MPGPAGFALGVLGLLKGSLVSTIREKLNALDGWHRLFVAMALLWAVPVLAVSLPRLIQSQTSYALTPPVVSHPGLEAYDREDELRLQVLAKRVNEQGYEGLSGGDKEYFLEQKRAGRLDKNFFNATDPQSAAFIAKTTPAPAPGPVTPPTATPDPSFDLRLQVLAKRISQNGTDGLTTGDLRFLVEQKRAGRLVEVFGFHPVALVEPLFWCVGFWLLPLAIVYGLARLCGWVVRGFRAG